jgi:hypothetical protein
VERKRISSPTTHSSNTELLLEHGIQMHIVDRTLTSEVPLILDFRITFHLLSYRNQKASKSSQNCNQTWNLDGLPPSW